MGEAASGDIGSFWDLFAIAAKTLCDS